MSEDRISAFAFNVAEQIEDLINVRTKNLEEDNRKYEWENNYDIESIEFKVI